MNPTDIYSWVKAEESNFETEEIQVGDNFHWNFRKHVQMIFHLKNGVFFTGQNNWLRAFKNIMEPILNLAYWTEDLEVKDVVFFIEEQTGRVLSFLIKKYHDEVYVREHDLDTLFDNITESDIDYGGVLVQKGAEEPEVLPLNSVAFCDQTDILGGPIFFKHYFSPSKLRSMSEYGWGDEKNGATISLEDLCMLATFTKDPVGTTGQSPNKVPGKTLEIYIGRGNMPENYLTEDGDPEYQCNQIQIVAFYQDKEGKQQGVTLYRKKEDEGNIKFHTSKEVYGRALGRGTGETLIHPQIWTNFLTIHKTAMLEAGSKSPLVTDDPSWTTKNKIQDMENLEVTTIEQGMSVQLVPTIAPANVSLFEREVNDWFMFAQKAGSAEDPIMGAEAASGTTFRGQERSVAQGRGSHDRRRGQRAKFIEGIYRDWIIPDITREITKGKTFLASLSNEELTWVADQLVTNHVNRRVQDLILSGKFPTTQEQQALTEVTKATYLKQGNKKLIEILKEDFKDIEIKMGINIAGKQKNLANLSDKVLSIFQQAFANPQGFLATMQIPGMGKAFEDILEFGGLNLPDFSTLIQAHTMPAQVAPQPNPQQPAGVPNAPELTATAQ